MRYLSVFFIFINSLLFAQGNFTQEWESPANRIYVAVQNFEKTNNIPEIILRDESFNMYVLDGNTKIVKHTFTDSDSSSFGTRAGVASLPLDVNSDGIYEIVQTKTYYNPDAFRVKIVNGANGAVIYDQTWNGYNGSFNTCDIDGDGYTEMLVNLGVYNTGLVISKLVIISTTSLNSTSSNSGVTSQFRLEQNYPNPFNPGTTIDYSIQKDADVIIKIYDMLGQEVNTLFNGKQKSGYHNISFDGTGLSSGTYFYQIIVDGAEQTRKMVFVK